MSAITQFKDDFAAQFPDVRDILAKANLVVDARVYKIVLHGSRGPAGGSRPDSDLDLTFIVDDSGLDRDEFEHCACLRHALELTLRNWQGSVRPDLSAIFDLHGCGMPCLADPGIDVDKCPRRGIDCFGVFRCQKRCDGYLQHAGTQVKRMRPCVTVWERG